jgi:hypothetical protein
MTIELTVQIFATFKRYTGLYFYSLVVCTWCICVRQIGRLCVYFVSGLNEVFSLTVTMLGWVGMVTGFAVVLYSRLHLVTRNRKILRAVLCMIIFNVFALHMTTMIAQIGVVTKRQPQWISWYPDTEKIQIVGFTIQEIIISGIYVRYIYRLVGDNFSEKTKRNMKLLVLVQVVCILIDFPFIYLAFADLFLIKAMASSLCYAIKIKLEFIVLNQLMDIAKGDIVPRDIQNGPIDEEQGEKPMKSRSAPAILSAMGGRRFSRISIFRRPTVTPQNSTKSPPKSLASTPERCEPDRLDFRPVYALPAPPQTDVMSTRDSSNPNTFIDSMITTSSAYTEPISSPELRMTNSFPSVETRYLGQYGMRTVLAS